MKKQVFLILAVFMLLRSAVLPAAANSSGRNFPKKPELQEFQRNPGRFDAFLHTEHGQSDFIVRLTKGRAFLEQFSSSSLKEQKDTLKRVVSDNLCNAAKFLFCSPLARDILNEQRALLYSVESGHEKMVELCLNAQVNPDMADDAGNTSLHNALFRKLPIKIIKLLLAANADHSFSTAKGETPVHIAAYVGYSDAVKELLIAGADQNIYNTLGILPLHFAVQQGHAAVVEHLLPGQKDVNAPAPGMGGRPALSIAIAKGHVDICRILLEHGANPNLLHESYSLLYQAVDSGNLEIIKLLLLKGADPNILTSNNESPLSAASNKGFVPIIKLLFAFGAKPNTLGVGSPLYAAAQNGHAEAVEILLANGADPNLVRSDKFSPLHMATFKGHKAIVEKLITCAVSTRKSEISGSPLIIALARGYDDIADVLLECKQDAELINDSSHHGAMPIWIACSKGNMNMIDKLIGLGADPNCLHRPIDTGGYPIHRAAEHKDVAVLNFLISLNVDTNVLNRYKETPLYIAASCGNLQAVTVLCQAGANKEVQNILGLTALDIAQANGHKEIVRFLLYGPIVHTAKSPVSDTVYASSSIDDAEREVTVIVPEPVEKVIEQKSHRMQSQRRQSSRANMSKKSRGQPMPLVQVFKRVMGAHEQADTEKMFALRQAAEDMTVVVYKGARTKLPNLRIGKVSEKQDKFHLFSSEVDLYLNRGIYIDGKNQGSFNSLLNEYGIRDIHGFCVILPGKIENGHYDVRYIQYEQEGESSYGYTGAFVYLFDRNGDCYHRCFHQSRESKRRHNVLD